MSNWEPYSQHQKIHIDKRFRIGSCAFPQHIVRNFRRLSCAHGSASYRADSAVYGAEIPHDRCISAAYHAISARSVHFRSISCDFRRSLCASAGSCAEIPHGHIRKLVSICNFRLYTATFEPRHENKSCSACPKEQT